MSVGLHVVQKAAGISTSRLNFDQFTGARMTKCPQNIRIAIPAETP